MNIPFHNVQLELIQTWGDLDCALGHINDVQKSTWLTDVQKTRLAAIGPTLAAMRNEVYALMGPRNE